VPDLTVVRAQCTPDLTVVSTQTTLRDYQNLKAGLPLQSPWLLGKHATSGYSSDNGGHPRGGTAPLEQLKEIVLPRAIDYFRQNTEATAVPDTLEGSMKVLQIYPIKNYHNLIISKWITIRFHYRTTERFHRRHISSESNQNNVHVHLNSEVASRICSDVFTSLTQSKEITVQ
jgi:hypothetical protein